MAQQKKRSKIVNLFKNRPIESILVTVLLILGLLSIIGLSSVEPYQRTMFVAMLPSQLLMAFLQAAIFAGIYSYMFRGSGMPFTGTKVKADSVHVPLSSVIGLKHVKQEVTEVINFLKDHSRLQSAGGRMLNGILFTGEPGTGKTLLAKAVATECGLPFIGISGAGFVEMFVGVGASRVRDLFKRAATMAEEHGGCVIFIDEFDALGKAREYTPYGSMEDNRTVNQFLEKMDGVARENRNILVIAATNAKVETLDPAITRPGRFDRHIQFNKPNYEDRLEMIKFYTAGKRISSDVDFPGLARTLVNSSGADIENLVNEALHISFRRNGEEIANSDFSSALERLKLGIERRLSMTEDEKRSVAIHESGHAMAERLFSKSTSIFKLSIVPRTGSLGVAWSEDKEERHLAKKSDFESRLRVLLGGYVAEKAFLGETSDGVASDFEKATQIARVMAAQLGMGKYLGYFSEADRNSLSEDFRAKLDGDVQEILSDAVSDLERSFGSSYARMTVQKLSDALLEKEELDEREIDAIFNSVAQEGKAAFDLRVG